ncbi:MAG: hypothetical protein HC919_08035 [Oscillatoriales cyanobacterium SM2_2_1]|nr:hypothetical protein [Oscillatoriales cyanobacterium SM2_2_1]
MRTFSRATFQERKRHIFQEISRLVAEGEAQEVARFWQDLEQLQHRALVLSTLDELEELFLSFLAQNRREPQIPSFLRSSGTETQTGTYGRNSRI